MPNRDLLKLRDTVRASDYFICLVSSETHKSRNVEKEVRWAKEVELENNRDITIIPILQVGFQIQAETDYPDWFTWLLTKNGIPVSNENPLDYSRTIDQLLNRLGKVAL